MKRQRRVYKKADELAEQLEKFRKREMEGREWTLTDFEHLVSEFLELLRPEVRKVVAMAGKQFRSRMETVNAKKKKTDELMIKRAARVRDELREKLADGSEMFQNLLVWRTAKELRISDPVQIGRLTDLPPDRVKRMLAERQATEWEMEAMRPLRCEVLDQERRSPNPKDLERPNPHVHLARHEKIQNRSPSTCCIAAVRISDSK
jgi:hypothetical protein